MPVSVLIVDDDPIFRAQATRLLADCGLDVVGEADSAAAGLSAAKELEPSAALVDVGLPDHDGFTLARQLAALPKPPRVVLTSVEVELGQVDAVRRSGAVTFVPKAGLPQAPLQRLFGAE